MYQDINQIQWMEFESCLYSRYKMKYLADDSYKWIVL